MFNSNPLLKEETFRSPADMYESSNTMTVQGTAIKTGILLLILTTAAAITWKMTYNAVAAGNIGAIMPYLWGGVIGGFILFLITMFFKQASPITAPIYAVFEGLFLGALSAMFEIQYPGIVVQAVGSTLGVLFVMLALYATGVIPVTKGFIIGVVSATAGIMLFYLFAIVAGWIFGLEIAVLDSSNGSLLSIGFSVVVVIVASLNLVLDFHMIDVGSKTNSPKYMEWYGAFALLVTIVWLYIEILRLLSKLRNR
ncbi:Bax inhibitor-1/YccA family protein [Planctomycetota bacterium]|nr:Bax inhibitor-1/YccA family protein [Planctomycetota bacterium]